MNAAFQEDIAAPAVEEERKAKKRKAEARKRAKTAGQEAEEDSAEG